jgi:hypothetical protein
MTDAEVSMMFEREGDEYRVRPWLKEGIRWHLGDVRDSNVLGALGPQDLVVANNFLCHMKFQDAEACLRRIVQVVRVGGYLVVSGIDLDVRTKVATDLRWNPVTDLLEEIHEGDAVLRRDWPSRYWGLEPLDKGLRNWRTRYAAVFQIVDSRCFN